VHGIKERIKEKLKAAGLITERTKEGGGAAELKYVRIKFGNSRITETKLRAAELEAMNEWNKQSKGHSR
jgi:hypothetical protein